MSRVVARVDLDAVRHNAEQLKSRLASSTAFCAVVKADAYGHGADMVAPVVADLADILAVATVEEAEQLRTLLGRSVRILVLGHPDRCSLVRAADIGAESVVSDTAQLRAAPKGTPLHVKVDTGMNRAGFKSAAEAHASWRPDRVVGLMTHLACADDPSDPSVQQQLDRFLEACSLLDADHHLVRHAANTAATLARPEAHLDMVRCGMGIYGVDPRRGGHGAGLLPALSLTSQVAHVWRAAPGEGVGYGHTFVTRRATTLALVPVGYGDGMPRAVSNAGVVVVGDRPARIVGRVSMDSLVVDLGDHGAAVGDPVELIGPSITASDVAESARTIPYEILTRLSPRVPRVSTTERVPGRTAAPPTSRGPVRPFSAS
ncbi:alanine racemase [Streptomyces luteogriseus]|uniref:alanine racemase n=1 Tax=Streptomyces luteogriseus TaxID=68233 RepID=UPI0037B0B65B